MVKSSCSHRKTSSTPCGDGEDRWRCHGETFNVISARTTRVTGLPCRAGCGRLLLACADKSQINVCAGGSKLEEGERVGPDILACHQWGRQENRTPHGWWHTLIESAEEVPK